MLSFYSELHPDLYPPHNYLPIMYMKASGIGEEAKTGRQERERSHTTKRFKRKLFAQQPDLETSFPKGGSP